MARASCTETFSIEAVMKKLHELNFHGPRIIRKIHRTMHLKSMALYGSCEKMTMYVMG